MNGQALEPALYREVVRRALAEDLSWGDVTTQLVVRPEARAVGVLTSRSTTVLAGLDVALEAFRQLDPALEVETWRHDGDLCRPSDRIASVRGLAAPMLTAERTALNFLRHLSGVASATHRLVQTVGGALRIADTRKTLPLLRALEKYAVRVGGGINARQALDDAIVVKQNHARVAGGLRAAIERARAARPDLPVEAEALSVEDVEDALQAGAAVVLFTGPSASDLEQVVRRCAGRVRLVVSGPLPADRVAALAVPGADALMAGSIIDSAPAADIALELRPE
jgi:nicotinate-nucleotide pyrophosphorylase (carboxylating)